MNRVFGSPALLLGSAEVAELSPQGSRKNSEEAKVAHVGLSRVAGDVAAASASAGNVREILAQFKLERAGDFLKRDIDTLEKIAEEFPIEGDAFRTRVESHLEQLRSQLRPRLHGDEPGAPIGLSPVHLLVLERARDTWKERCRLDAQAKELLVNGPQLEKDGETWQQLSRLFHDAKASGERSLLGLEWVLTQTIEPPHGDSNTQEPQ